MNSDLSKPGSDALPSAGAGHVWPLRRYSRRDRMVRVIGGSIVGGALLIWLNAYWHSSTMRFVSLGLLAAIVWLIAPVVFDQNRSTDRQITIDDYGLRLHTTHAEVTVAWHDIKHAQWRQDRPDKFGLWLFDGDESVLAHLDAKLLADQGEARAFIKWAKQLAEIRFDIQWTQV